VDRIIPAVYLEIEVSASSNVGKAIIGIAFLRNLPNAEVDGLSIGKFAVDGKFQLKVIKIGLTPLVGPPEVCISYGQLRCLCLGNRDLFRLIPQQ